MSTTPTRVNGGLNRSLLSDQAYELLKEQLLAREFPPGTRLVESDIARQLSVSQAPVRDALRRLAHEGLVLQLPRRGSFVAEVSAEEIRDAYALRAALEEFAVKEAMEHVSGSLLKVLEQEIDTMLAAAAQDSTEQLVDADVRFHKAVWEAGGNRFLPRAWLMVETSMRSLTVVSNRILFGSLADVARTHFPLLEGLRSRDPATPAMFRDHAVESWKRLDSAARAEVKRGD
ncbi:MAG: GntR family transcriptional regulator [Propionicimonas sp.]|nr:GntR family transcriptional regulator [Propionicimonas sp.]